MSLSKIEMRCGGGEKEKGKKKGKGGGRKAHFPVPSLPLHVSSPRDREFSLRPGILNAC